ncbi:MAG TPA: TIGR04563 family protein [Anaeromyxobacter sp.]|nr:TIGR04563 family protein [Anaeromyxobacter sp.]
MGATEKQKQSLYFPEDTLQEIMKQATRLDRSLSWTVQQAWRIAREHVRKFPPATRDAEVERELAPAAEPRRSEARSDTPAPVDDFERVRASAEVREFLKGKFDHHPSS